MAVKISATAKKQAEDHIETLARSMFAIHGFPAPGGTQLGTIVEHAMARISPHELRDPKNISTASLGELDGLVRGSVGVGQPRNEFGADAARAAQASGAGAHHGWHGDGSAHGRYASLSGGRGNREAANDSGDGASGHGSGGGAGRSSTGYGAIVGTGGEPAGAPFWGSSKGMMMTRAYANDNNMNWAPPDLMKMGRPALQAMKDSGLKGDGYKALHDPSGLHLSNKSIVAGAAGYMKRNKIDHNEAGKASAAVDKLDMPKAMRERHRAAVDGIHTSKPENEAERREALRKSDDEIEHHKPGNKAYKAAVDRERAGYKLDQGAAPKAEQKAEQKGAAAQSTGQQAKASKSKLDAALGP